MESSAIGIRGVTGGHLLHTEEETDVGDGRKSVGITGNWRKGGNKKRARLK